MTTVDPRPEAVVPEKQHQTLQQKLASKLGSSWVLLFLIVLVAVFTVLRPSQFASSYNLSTLAIDAAVLLVLAVGQTYVIITAGIDLSVGSVLVFSSVVGAKVMLALSGSDGSTYGTTDGSWGVIAIGLLASVAAGTIFGLINGFLIARARIPALIVTLGTMGIALGAAQIITNGQDVRAVPELLITHIGTGAVAGIPVLVVIAVLVAAIAGAVLAFTRFGTWTYAVGSSSEAARRSGVPLRAQIIKVYAISGALAGLAGMMSVARFSTTTIGGHTADNLATISAVVLGGTSLFGGIGSIVGTIIGVFIPIVLLNGFVILGIPPFWQTVAMGAVLILAVYVDQIKRRNRNLS
ncbi:ABC transporter permease [Rhodococcus sp. WS3]|uniref:ABC transporter permease n=1 Tax=unclassified Rhodococcus (in: high G+C Gram-positive bacteria) TaxID=192944 RepID=UPI0005D44A36|nr:MULTISPECIES: ABC transporter permease [unclassified Rhodococcus (in: high G+C Gram-positive bacteria)]KJF19303.1 Ribose transport system permease protein rbsC [Rhodococcus sp. AD45]ROZ42741.1 ABC transporter permease [Rhodococcus sp. WS3]RZL21772.1 MAG: ABC transporter permease [Rhodococcus sp. (in: high G+C Gram-positive bacteria)]